MIGGEVTVVASFRARPEKAERFFRNGRAGQWKDVPSSLLLRADKVIE
ncbi:MAG: hypothetical protein WAV38_13165 [Xanthobacteraceae bacterium]